MAVRDCILYCRCFTALGDVSKARYLHETNMIAEEAAKTMVPSLLCLSVKIHIVFVESYFLAARILYLLYKITILF